MAHLGPPVCKIGPDSGHRLRLMLKILFPFTVVTTPGGWAKHTERRPSRLPMLDSETLAVGPELDGWGAIAHAYLWKESALKSRGCCVPSSGSNKVEWADQGGASGPWPNEQLGIPPGPGSRCVPSAALFLACSPSAAPRIPRDPLESRHRRRTSPTRSGGHPLAPPSP